VRRKANASSGERTDITAQSHAGDSEARVTIESKGCWNAGIKKAMRTQLVDQYLRPTGRRSGIYLVFWFENCRSAGKPPRSCSRRNLDNLRRTLKAQAEELRSEGFDIHSVVIDGSIAFAPPKKTAKKKQAAPSVDAARGALS